MTRLAASMVLGAVVSIAACRDADIGSLADLGVADAITLDAIDDPPDARDAGVLDAGAPDLGPREMGPSDIGPSDAGPLDVGPRDTGPDALDAGPTDGCTRDDDCPDPQRCSVVISDDGERFATACRDPDPAGGHIGGPCVLGSRCTNGLTCVGDRCREVCGEIADCEAGEVCSSAPFSRTDLSDCSLVTFIAVCHQPCGSPGDCGPEQTCHAIKPVGSSRVANGICGAALAAAETGELCSLSDGDLCRDGLCNADGFCTERCVADADCPAGFLCVTGPRWTFPCEVPLTMTTCAPR